MTLMQAYLTFKKYQKCSHMFTVISNTTSIEDGAAYLAVFAVIDWSQVYSLISRINSFLLILIFYRKDCQSWHSWKSIC